MLTNCFPNSQRKRFIFHHQECEGMNLARKLEMHVVDLAEND